MISEVLAQFGEDSLHFIVLVSHHLSQFADLLVHVVGQLSSSLCRLRLHILYHPTHLLRRTTESLFQVVQIVDQIGSYGTRQVFEINVRTQPRGDLCLDHVGNLLNEVDLVELIDIVFLLYRPSTFRKFYWMRFSSRASVVSVTYRFLSCLSISFWKKWCCSSRALCSPWMLSSFRINSVRI